MLSSVTSFGYQSLHSSPAINVSKPVNVPGPTNNAGSDSDQEPQIHSANTPNNIKEKVNGVVDSQEKQATNRQSTQSETESNSKASTAKANAKQNTATELSEEELKEVQELKQRDIEVRAHEAAHLAAAGQYAQGGANFTLQRGPDGKSYAIGGSVSIDTSAEADPEATIRKADQIRRAALAPAEPSGQDRSVAANAAKLKLKAQVELAQIQRTETIEESVKEDAVEGSGKVTIPPPQAANPAQGTEVNTNPAEAKSGVEQLKSAAALLCEICSGDHPTAPHLEANQRKAGAYTTISQA